MDGKIFESGKKKLRIQKYPDTCGRGFNIIVVVVSLTYSLKYRLLFYNAMIRPVMAFVNVFWSSCDRHCLNRVLKLQKRAARIIILDAYSQASFVKLFNKLKWIPFYEQAKIAKCCIMYKRLKGHVPAYLKTLLKFSSETHSRQTRYAILM